MKIAIIGMGYVGLPLAIRFASASVEVVGIDIDDNKINKLKSGKSYIRHINTDDLQELVQSGKFMATTDFKIIRSVDAIIICVPTPLGQHNEPDISYVLKTAQLIAPNITPFKGNKKLIVLESTTYPGTTDEDLRITLEKLSDLKAGVDFHLAYSPEREDPGRTDYSVKSIPKVMGGYTDECLDRCVELYSKALDKVHAVSSTRVAEATKLMENIFRAVNIALVNELKIVYKEMGIDVWEVIDAAATKPFGYMPFYPGPGLGGHCIPIDPFYLTWKAKEYGKHTRFIELAGEINTQMPEFIVSHVLSVLNENKKPINGSNILILGLAYKPNVDDYRESPSFALIELLESMGANVSYNDPYITEIRETREHEKYNGKKSKEINDKDYDLLLISTHHSEYIEKDFKNYNTPIIDTRSCLKIKPKYYTKA